MAKGKITVDKERCKGCGLCVTACPFDLLELDPKELNSKGYQPMIIKEPDKCTACASCALMCPDVVITVERFISE